VPGPTVFGTGAASVFNTLTTVVGQLGSGTPTATQLNAALNALDANISTAEQASAVLGNGSVQVAAASASLTAQLTSVQNTQAGLEDVNVATVTTQLDSQMTNYQAAMWAASQAIPETLVHFL
jgi:flagellin-like hook-associated protein FlgL